MPLLGITNREKGNYKLVGALLPLQVDSYLSLYTLSKGLSKSKILRGLIGAWVNKQRAREPDSILAQKVVQKANYQWMVTKATNTRMTFGIFKNMITQELSSRGIEKKYIDLITNGIEE
jgi:hypothetical protein